MVGRDRDHPSVIIWSIGNENSYGSNFQKEYELAESRRLDAPGDLQLSRKDPGGVRTTDILSLHYPSLRATSNNMASARRGFRPAQRLSSRRMGARSLL